MSYNKFEYLKAFNSPFKRPKLKWYIGKVAIGTPYFYPRKWVKFSGREILDKAKEKYDKCPIKDNVTLEKFINYFKGHKKAVPKKIGFDFVGLGWKTKWTDTDYRFEYSPVISFVFFKWQIAVIVVPEEKDHYWEAWLYYNYNTTGTKRERIEKCKKEFPLTFTVSNGKEKKTVNYYDLILKPNYR